MKFRKKPVVIEAVQWTMNNFEEVRNFVDTEGVLEYSRLTIFHPDDDIISIGLVTLEGVMNVSKYDWIIKGVQGEFYPCKPDIFEKTYEKVEE